MRTALDEALADWVSADPRPVREAFSDRDALHGRELGWEGGPDTGGRAGTGAGIDERGNLLVRAAGEADRARLRRGSAGVASRRARSGGAAARAARPFGFRSGSPSGLS